VKFHRTGFAFNLRVAAFFIGLLGLGTLTACGGGGGGSSPPPAPTLTAIAVTPATPSVTRGATQQFTATGSYSDGSSNNISASVTWESTSTAVATIAASGLATSVSVGTTTIRATLSGVSGTATLTVTPPTLTSIAVTPANPSIPRGTTQQFTATGTYSDNTTNNITATVTWSSVDTAIATIAGTGLATGAAAGSTTIRATLSGVTGSTGLTVTAPVLTSIAVTPGNVTLNYQGATQQLVATGTYSDQSTADLTNAVTWESSSTSVATVGPDGFATAVASGGATTVTARSGALSATASIAVQTATVSGTVTIPDSDMGWKPSIGGLQVQGAGGKVRVLGTNIVADVVATGNTTGTFTLSGVPIGAVTLVFDEGSYYDIFTAASKRVAVNVASANVSGVSFNFVYHWRELAGYPPPWGTNSSQGAIAWKAQFISENIAFIAFRTDLPSERVEIWRTLDRGANWTRVAQWIFDQALWGTLNYAYPSWWQNFYFLDANRGVMHATNAGIPCDGGGGYFQTGDGGQTWSLRVLPLTPTGYHVQTQGYARIGNDRIVMVGTVGCGVQGYVSGFYDAIWESADAGVTWELKWNSPQNTAGAFIGVDANNNGRAVAFRGGGIQEFMLRDAQGNWTARANAGIANSSRDIAMVGDTTWILSVGGIAPDGTYRSLDAGANWSRMSGGTPQDFDFVTQLKGFTQAGGPAYSTYDGGVTWRYQAAGGAIWPGVMDIWGFDRTHAAWAEVGFGDPNQRAQLFTYVEPVTANVEAIATATPANATVGRGAANNVMAQYELRNNGPVPITIQSVTLRASGSGNDAANVIAVKLWRDANGDGSIDGGDTQLASGTYATDNGTVTFNTASLGTLEQTQTVRLLVSYDLSAATGYSGTFRYALAANDVVARDADTNAAVTVSLPGNFTLTSRTITVVP
jgi:hypothetical protein